jgi:hypothetical protein
MSPFQKWCLFVLREDIEFFWAEGKTSSPTFKMKRPEEGPRDQMYTELDQWYLWGIDLLDLCTRELRRRDGKTKM